MTRCACCAHPEHLAIMRQHAFGAPLKKLADRYDLHHMAIWRCWKNHVSAETKASFALG